MIPVPEDVVIRAREMGRGSKRLEVLMAFVREKLPEGDEVVDWQRENGVLHAVTRAIPDRSRNPVPPKYRRRTGRR